MLQLDEAEMLSRILNMYNNVNHVTRKPFPYSNRVQTSLKTYWIKQVNILECRLADVV